MRKTIHCTNTLIIGQGLAGSLLAWQLMQQGQQISIVCDEAAPCASRVAAGLFNPVTGQRLVLQEQAAHIIPSARRCYQTLETQFDEAFFHDIPMLRILNNDNERQSLYKRCQDKAYTPYMGQHIDTVDSIRAPHGVCEQQQTGYLDTNALLDRLRTFFIQQESYFADHFDFADLEITSNGVIWKHIHAKRIIFCQGFMDQTNPWFKWLPFQPAKGEILTLTSDSALPTQIINGGKWLLPLHNGQYKTGATYSHNLSTIEATPAAKTELLNGLQKLFLTPVNIDVIRQQAGVRPNTRDKHPFIGLHPEKPQIGIFNGFGSKGSMLIPHYAQAFTDHLTHGTPIPHEADIIRISDSNKKSRTKAQARLSLTERVHQNLLPHIQAACSTPQKPDNDRQHNYIAIDATAGNGHDTLFLARHIQNHGQVFAFDIQKQAIDNTFKRLKEAELSDYTTLCCCGHEEMLEHIPHAFVGNVNLIMFNLGYLPQADKTVITQTNSTIQALNASIQLIAPNGHISILAYPGHAGGARETDAVISWLETLPASFSMIKHKSLHDNPHSPRWFEVIRHNAPTETHPKKFIADK
ncbi:FAD-dependent oxidoreductase [Mariprofundus sp. EBB-1]|uniref:FAD-dependent oxidoreductase n=1 Tax=Mariprofundus sp. EBB-1 TaxID=2650971 RepID=UPI000EF19236|nr:FAD-dependent oxidoreductase [Mariprofundus sp. EBB-1]RLL55045.1 FAD-dependent oxidoreductase [Mariprofundus sp. EBB-1]